MAPNDQNQNSENDEDDDGETSGPQSWTSPHVNRAKGLIHVCTSMYCTFKENLKKDKERDKQKRLKENKAHEVCQNLLIET